MKGHLQQDVVCHGRLSCVTRLCRAAEPGGGGVFTPGVEVVGSCCCGFSCLFWIVSCLNADMETPRRRCFLLQEETDGWGGGTHEVSAVEWFHTGLCPFWSRRREPGSPAGARGGTGRAWRCWDSALPRAPAGTADGRVGLPLALRHGCFPQRSPRSCWGGGQRCLGRRSLCCIRSSVLPALGIQLLPGMLRRGDSPSLLCPRIALLSCWGLSQTTSLTFFALELPWEQVGSS